MQMRAYDIVGCGSFRRVLFRQLRAEARIWVRLTGATGVCAYFFFFSSRRRHTRYWRDWSSDVCSSDLQSASATTDVITGTTIGEGGGAADTTTTNNVSNAVLGSLFLTAESELTSFNPINETYMEISFVSNITIMPPNTPTRINTTETGNLTVSVQPNGLDFGQGQSVLVTVGGDGAEQENATTTFVQLSRVRPDGTGSGTGVAFFSTNSTGQLAFLDNMVGILQLEISPEGDITRMWEWNGGTLAFENGSGGGAATTGNQTTTTTQPDEE